LPRLAGRSRDRSRLSFTAVGDGFFALDGLLECSPSLLLLASLLRRLLALWCVGGSSHGENILDAVLEHIPRSQTAGNVEALLPPLVFSAFSFPDLL
jgi:hypothetical protein